MPSREWFVAFLVGCLIGLGILFGAHLGHQQTSACVQVNDLRAALVNILNNSEKGLPQSPYFQEHPGELAKAQHQYSYDLSKLGPTHC